LVYGVAVDPVLCPVIPLKWQWTRPKVSVRNTSPISHKALVLRQVAHPTTLSDQGVMSVGKRLARVGLVWMAFFKSA
jgi:hypothetical protein